MPSVSDLPHPHPSRRPLPEPLPADPLGQRLCQTFPYLWRSILAPTPIGSEKPQWLTETRYPLRPRTLWSLWQDAARLVGVRFGTSTQYGLIDIDASSPHLTPQGIAHIKAALETIGICRVIIIRSSWNGGVHLYLPLPKPIATWQLALALKQCLLAQNLTIAPGQLELFPNCKPWGNHLRGEYTEYQAHRLPLQPGSGSLLLDNDLQPLNSDLAHFFQHWDQAAAAEHCPSTAKADLEGGRGGVSTTSPSAQAPLSLDGVASAHSPQLEFGEVSSCAVIEDLSEITMQIQVRVRRLGLTKAQIDDFIGQHFEGRRRSQLADDELVLLLYRLQAWELDTADRSG